MQITTDGGHQIQVTNGGTVYQDRVMVGRIETTPVGVRVFLPGQSSHLVTVPGARHALRYFALRADK